MRVDYFYIELLKGGIVRKLFFMILTCLLLVAGCDCLGRPIERELAEQMKSSDPDVRFEAARQLGDVATTEAERILMVHEEDPDFRVRDEIRKSLRTIRRRTFYK